MIGEHETKHKKRAFCLFVCLVLAAAVPAFAFGQEGAPAGRAGDCTITQESELADLFPDEAFRHAVFEAVRDGSDDATGADLKDALGNFTGSVQAAKKGIVDIHGIELLRNANYIDLDQNLIQDVGFLEQGDVNNYYLPCTQDDAENVNNVTWNIMRNPFTNLPTHFGGRLRNGVEVASRQLQNGKTDYEFDGMARADADGNAYAYTVAEDPVAGYDIANVFVNGIAVRGVKNWVDFGGKLCTRPDKLVLKLLQNGVEYRTLETDEAAGWRYAFQDLPRYDRRGRATPTPSKRQPSPQGTRAPSVRTPHRSSTPWIRPAGTRPTGTTRRPTKRPAIPWPRNRWRKPATARLSCRRSFFWLAQE